MHSYFSRNCLSDMYRARRRPVGRSLFLLILFAVLLGGLPGCSGCRRATDEEKKAAEEEKKKNKPKPNYEVKQPAPQPSDSETALCWYKPGHWTSVTLDAKANNFDVVGQLQVSLADRDGQEIPLLGLPYSLVESRDVALPKGQQKVLHSTLFVPVQNQEPVARGQSLQAALTQATATQPKTVNATYLISGRGGKRFESSWPLARMPSYQYHFAVLSLTPERYVSLRTKDSIKPPCDSFENRLDSNHYRVSLLKVGRNVSLPAEAMFWTSIAYVLWDDVEPGSLSPQQQKALVDWLHWGGQLIVSGPATLDGLRDSFLSDYLPAADGGNWDLNPADFDEINANFALPEYGKLTPSGEWTGVKLKLASKSRFLPGTGKLFAERRVGRGRVVVSAIRLSDRDLTTWRGFDELLNACLLRRPPREYRVNQMGETELLWATESPQSPHNRKDPFDAALTCGLRYFTRDTDVGLDDYAPDIRKLPDITGADTVIDYGNSPAALDDTGAVGSGMAAWRNFCPAATQARAALQNAARVEIPNRMFVVWVVGLYLLILVPLNWAVFGALGRVEWAWAAAPMIAIGCTLAVIRLAQLDIGFARSVSELSVIELQGDLPRAHVTRYTALYTSLTTGYTVRHKDPGAVVSPFPARINHPDDFRQGLDTLYYEHGKDVALRGFMVRSNRTGLLHSEQMVELDGPLVLKRGTGGKDVVRNYTGIDLRGVGVVRRTEKGDLQTAWVGDLYRSASAALKFHPVLEKPNQEAKPGAGGEQPGPQVETGLWPEERESEVQTQSQPLKGEFNFSGLIRLAEQTKDLQPGDYRLIGWADESIPGVEIEPQAPQSRSAAMIVANLAYGFGKDPRRDVNSRESVEPKKVKTEDDSQ